MTRRIYIDGEAGTTGLLLRELLENRSDLELSRIDPDRRKDPAARAALLAEADISVLCLPDDAAREAVAMSANTQARLLDASTAHRTSPGWVYGLAELDANQRAAIRSAARVANPGCWPTAVILLLRPLIAGGLLSPDAPLTIHGVSGYSGGGRKMIESWETPGSRLNNLPFHAPYALDKEHKHIPEMTRYAGLSRPPHFAPSVCSFRQGMRVEIPLHQAVLAPGVRGEDIAALWRTRYASETFVSVRPFGADASDEQAFDPRAHNGTNRIELAVVANPFGHVLLIATLDNLGKGAARAAVQNLNLMLGLDENVGLAATAAA
jgi:N-acetyl-gamma-glutamyl-phosphate reductase